MCLVPPNVPDLAPVVNLRALTVPLEITQVSGTNLQLEGKLLPPKPNGFPCDHCTESVGVQRTH